MVNLIRCDLRHLRISFFAVAFSIIVRFVRKAPHSTSLLCGVYVECVQHWLIYISRSATHEREEYFDECTVIYVYMYV